MPRKKNREGLCALCGQKGKVTREHVPPQGLFLKPLPSNMITVPTCQDCNNGSKLDDEYFRILIATVASPGEKLFELWTTKVVGSTLSRSPALKKAILLDQARLIEFHKEVPLKTFDGRVVPDKVMGHSLCFDASRINRTLVKIVRCLYYFHHEANLSKSTFFEISNAPLERDRLEQVIRGRKDLIGNHNEFLYFF